MRHNVSSYNDENYESGERVFYKRNDKRWCGPAVIIGRDGKTIIVKHGGDIIRVHISRITMVNPTGKLTKSQGPQMSTETDQPEQRCDESLESEDSEEDGDGGTIRARNEDALPSSGAVVEVDQREIDETIDETNVRAAPESLIDSKSHPSVKSDILYRKQGSSDEWKRGFVYSRAGKVGKHRSGKHKAEFNIQDCETKEITQIDFDDGCIEWLPVSSEVLLTNHDKNALLNAKKLELENWKKNGVFEEVDDINQHAVNTR